MFCVMSIMFLMPCKRTFCLISIFPPLAFSCWAEKALIVTVFAVVLLAFMLLRYKAGSPQPSTGSQLSILRVLALILLISYFEQSRRKPLTSLLRKP